MSKLDIVCLSTQLWEDPMWTNKQHVMSRLASRGHKVLYVDPLIRVRKLVKNTVFKRRYSPRRLITFEKKIQENLWLYSPVKLLFSENLESQLNVWNINRLVKRHNLNNPILWVYDPDFANYPSRLDHSLLIYDCVDDYASMPEERYSKDKREQIIKKEQILICEADIVFATSHYLYETRKKINPNTFYTPNVADFEHNKKALRSNLKVPDDVQDLPHPIIGFQGNLSAFKFDFDLIEYLVRERPNWSFVFIGPIETSQSFVSRDRYKNVDRIRKYKNAHFLGIKPYEDLPAYYKEMDVAIMPNKLNDYNRSSFPLKFFEFLGAGLPVVVTDIPPLADYKDSGVAYFAKNKIEFLKHIDVALKNPQEGLERRLSLAKKNSWDNKIDKMIGIIDTKLKTKNHSFKVKST